MFFKEFHFGCRKTIFDTTKVTYNTYSCAISGMSREMIKMDGRDSAECQNWEKGTKLAFLKLLSWIIGQNENSAFFFKKGEDQNMRDHGEIGSSCWFFLFLERVPSL